MPVDPVSLRLADRPDLLTPAEMALVDARAVALGVPVARLVAAAGRAVARAVRGRMAPCRTLVLCGPGNNGGDGRAAARYLLDAGWPVALAEMVPTPATDGLSRVALTPQEAARADLVIDAAFGAGISRPVPDAVAATLDAARRVVAVDVPSGLDGGTGAPIGRVRAADLTVTFVRLKPGHVLLPGRDLCGALVLADIGMPTAALDVARAATFVNGPFLWRVPTPATDAHKYARGHVAVLGGPAMCGAARLAASGARRAGAGLVSIAATGGSGDIYRAAASPGVIVVDADAPEAMLADARLDPWVCGPGLSAEDVRVWLPALLAAGRRVVADAGVFAAYAGAPDALRGAAVLTPHAGEFARVFGAPKPDHLSAARAAASQTGAVVLLKGADTVIAAPDGRAAINANAPPWLATAGAGDVLSGIVAGLLGQGMAAWDAACAAVWLHGEAASVAGPGLIAEDISPHLQAAVLRAQAG